MLRQSIPPITLETSQSTIQFRNVTMSIIITLGLFYLYLCFVFSLFFFHPFVHHKSQKQETHPKDHERNNLAETPMTKALIGPVPFRGGIGGSLVATRVYEW